MAHVAPYGTWSSPISLDLLTETAVGLSYPLATRQAVYFVEQRPFEGGRSAVVRQAEDGLPADVFGPGFNARTTVHEYGGLAYAVAGDTVFFTNYADQRLYRVRPGGEPEPLTGEPLRARSVRYAAPVVSPDGRFLFCVRERHPDPDIASGVVNDVVVLRTDGTGGVHALAEGHDFYAHVTVSPDGRRLAWTSWDHPSMPWDSTELWEAELDDEARVVSARLVAGGEHLSVTQPKYSPDGVLHFVADPDGWWNLHVDEGGETRVLVPMEAELGAADWVFGTSSYAILGDGSIVATWSERGIGRLGVLRPGECAFEDLQSAYTTFAQLRASDDGSSVLALAGAASEASAVVRIRAEALSRVGLPLVERLRASREATVDAAYLSAPQAIEFPTEGGLTAHALYYPPRSPDFEAPRGELPPLLVQVHGGPTSSASSVLNYGIQFWTSRGFAVVDVNYGGSTGYGREYRERLRGRWGVVDVDDCVNVARFLAESGRADPARLVIRGGSAGGWTTLCALTFRDAFASGTSYFGVADAAALARETHKFESRYMDSMIGPWPDDEERYEKRSPIFHGERLDTPMILFQGLEDKVVPPAQAEVMVAALDKKEVPHAYVAFEGEQHGFRRAENLRRTAEAELYFYGRVLGFVPAGELTPVDIAHEERLGTTPAG